MAIDLITQVQSLDINVLQRALSDIKQQATGIVYATSAADAVDKSDTGKMVIMDDGVTRRVYFKTGEGTVGYIALTV